METKLKLVFVVALFATSTLFAQSKIEVPYFKTLSGDEICGSPKCNPTIGIWQQIKGGVSF